MVKKWIAFCMAAVLLICQPVWGERIQEPENLYAMSAVLMDGETGRVLYEKEGYEPRPMASTTKVMTCIVALENTRGDEVVEVSSRAASQPEVKLFMKKGEKYYLEDLLYSLMLQSHNDTAVAIAEHVGKSVEGFAKMMNEKASALGCRETHFVTPNGLDDKDGGGVHSTTARDLALIMRYAIQNQTFLNITQTREYSFSDLEGKRNFTVTNANAFLDMKDGIISGKTGFTADAGYCYVCAYKDPERTLIVALLGCGWPNNKSYKWSDSTKLIDYGIENYEKRAIEEDLKRVQLSLVKVNDGIPSENNLYMNAYVKADCPLVEETEIEPEILMRKDEKIQQKIYLRPEVEAPVKKGQKLGTVSWYLSGKNILTRDITAAENVEKIDYSWCVEQVCQRFFH